MKATTITIPALFFCVFSSLPAFGRLGETPEEIEARFGKGEERNPPRFPNSRQMKYDHSGFEIHIFFYDGKSGLECYRRHSGRMSDKEIKEFIATLTDGKQWSYSKRAKLWYRDNKKTVAYREPGQVEWVWVEDRTLTKDVQKQAISDF